MNIRTQIQDYLAAQPDLKRNELRALHDMILGLMPGCRLWFLDGKNSEGKTVSNPSIGYGSYNMRHADKTSRDFYQIGLSANKTGISVYILGIKDRTYLAHKYGKKIGKATVTGYCIRFKTIKDIHTEALSAAIQDGLEATIENNRR